jgi:hypothetical protein
VSPVTGVVVYSTQFLVSADRRSHSTSCSSIATPSCEGDLKARPELSRLQRYQPVLQCDGAADPRRWPPATKPQQRGIENSARSKGSLSLPQQFASSAGLCSPPRRTCTSVYTSRKSRLWTLPQVRHEHPIKKIQPVRIVHSTRGDVQTKPLALSFR